MKWLRPLLGFALSLVLLWLLFRNVNTDELLASLRSANYVAVVPAILVYFSGIGVRAVRWRIFLAPVARYSTSRLYVATIIGFTVNNLMPIRLGEIARAILLARLGRHPGSRNSRDDPGRAAVRWADALRDSRSGLALAASGELAASRRAAWRPGLRRHHGLCRLWRLLPRRLAPTGRLVRRAAVTAPAGAPALDLPILFRWPADSPTWTGGRSRNRAVAAGLAQRGRDVLHHHARLRHQCRAAAALLGMAAANLGTMVPSLTRLRRHLRLAAEVGLGRHLWPGRAISRPASPWSSTPRCWCPLRW